MEASPNENPENTSLTPTRETEIDIIKGASNTEQIEAMQTNAAQQLDTDKPLKPAQILDVNNGENSIVKDQENNPTDPENPATRGI